MYGEEDAFLLAWVNLGALGKHGFTDIDEKRAKVHKNKNSTNQLALYHINSATEHTGH